MDVAGLTTGDITSWAQKVLHDGLEKVINSKASRRKPYYILVIIKNGYDGPAVKGGGSHLLHGQRKAKSEFRTMDLSNKRVVTNRLLIMEPEQVPAVPLIGTSLWRIDNKIGEVKCMYILPVDRPMVAGFAVEHESETVGKCAVGMPIVYGKPN